MRIDRLLCFLRFVKTRSRAQQLVDEGHIRCSRVRVKRGSHEVVSGDILTLPIGEAVKVVEILQLPERRGPVAEAHACYRVLDP